MIYPSIISLLIRNKIYFELGSGPQKLQFCSKPYYAVAYCRKHRGYRIDAKYMGCCYHYCTLLSWHLWLQWTSSPSRLHGSADVNFISSCRWTAKAQLLSSSALDLIRLWEDRMWHRTPALFITVMNLPLRNRDSEGRNSETCLFGRRALHSEYKEQNKTVESDEYRTKLIREKMNLHLEISS